jgi:prepilin-type N-terminal cleavage/methylation domain-containing protein
LNQSGVRSSDSGFSLLEVLIATVMLATAVVSLAELFAIATRSNLASRGTTYASILAAQKLEELRALTWGFDRDGLPLTDSTANTAASPETADGGTGLQASPEEALRANLDGWVDYVDRFGTKIGGGASPPPDARFIRRWSVAPLPADPANIVVIQVLVTDNRNRGDADRRPGVRLPEEARLVTVKARTAQ